MIHLKIPTHWDVGSVKKPKIEYIGMNWYRNCHYIELNKTKAKYSDSLSFLKGNKLKTPISITYIFHPSRKGQDMNNAIAICDKFLQDALVDHGVIPDDTYDHVTLTTSMVGDKDKEGYIEAIIEEITSR